MEREINKKVLRFDVELDQEHWDKFDKILESCHRSRKNFAEALIMLVAKSENNTIDF